MKVKKEQLSSCKVKLTFTLDANEFDAGLDQAFEKKVKDIDVPGFRKGKLPRAMYEKRFGVESLYEEAISILANKAYVEYLTKSKLHVVNYPELDVDFTKVAKGKKLIFTIEVEVWPTVELGQYKEIEVEKEKVEVTDNDINEYIDRVLKQHAELETVEGQPLEKGETAVFDFEGSIDGVLFDGGKADNYSLEIGSGQFIPGFEDQMVGMNIDEERIVKVTFPEDYHAKELAGKLADFKVVLHEIKKRVTPELTDDFVKDELEIKDVTTVDQYKAFVKDIILKDKTEASDNKFIDDLFNIVLSNAKVEIPSGLVDEEVERDMKQIEAQAKMYGITPELLLKYSGVEDIETYKKTIRPSAEMAVKHRIVCLEIAKVEKIKVTAKDYKNELKVIAEEIKGTVEDAEKRYSKEALTPYIQLQKVTELIKSSAIVK